MDELAQCYNVLPQLAINNTIDHRPEGDETWFLENEKTVTQFCRKLAAERTLKNIRDEYNYPKKKGIKDECSRLLEASAMRSCLFFQAEDGIRARDVTGVQTCALPILSSQHSEQRAFPRTARPHHANQLSAHDVEGNSLQPDLAASKAVRDLAYLQGANDVALFLDEIGRASCRERV